MKNLIELKIQGLILEWDSDVPYVLLERTDRAPFYCPVGPSEAGSILSHWEGIRPAQISLHDQMSLFLETTGHRIKSVELLPYTECSSGARLRYKQGLRYKTLELSPGDAMALGIRTSSPILADRTLFDYNTQVWGPLSSRKPQGDLLRAPWAQGNELSQELTFPPV